MSALASVLTGPIVEAVGWALLHLLWQGLLVAAILAATLALLRNQSANARYLASCGALLLLVTLGAVTAYRAYEPAVPSTLPPAITAVLSDSPMTIDTAATAAGVPAAGWRDTLLSAISWTGAHLPQVVVVWFLGVLILSVRLVAGWIGVHRLARRHSHEAGSDWERTLVRIAAVLDLRGSVRLLQSAAVEVPTVIGWFRPVILLPVATLSGLSIQQIEMILAHELAHIRRHDFIVNLMQSVIETLLFYHPAVWWISRRIRVEREHCCDDLAVGVFGDPVQYARALTRFEELRVDSRSVLAANGGSLLDRIRRLVLHRAETSNWTSRWAAGAALLTVLAAILVAPALPLFAGHDDQAPPAPPAKAEKAKTADKVKCDKSKDKTKDSDCDKASTAPKAVVDVEAAPADEGDVDVNVDVEPTPAPDIAQAVAEGVAAAVHVAPMATVAPAVRAVVAPMVAPFRPMAAIGWQDVRGGVEGGIAGGVIGGVTLEPGRLRHRTKIGANGKLSVDDLITLSSAGVTPKYIDEMRGAGLGDVSLDDIVAMRLQGINPAYVRALRDAGVDIKSVETVIALRAQGVSPDYIKEMAAAGYAHLATNDLILLRSQGVSSEFVKSLAEAGYANLSVKDLVRLRASGVNAEFIRELSKYRTK